MRKWLWLLMIGMCSMMAAQDNPFFGEENSDSNKAGYSADEPLQTNGPANPGGGEEPVPIDNYLATLFVIGMGIAVYMARQQNKLESND